ncbi:MAG TPA: tRNA (5-methylaminomethyl-2-thiouridine)(34)-methyltransferase MnmD [Flavobacterium sp.]
MERKIVTTKDGSTTIYLPEWEENYHSRHGAIQEAKHVFIKNGFSLFAHTKSVSILEMGFGTGLNAFITFLEAKKTNQDIDYVGIDAYPVTREEITLMNYVAALEADEYKAVFEAMHSTDWNIKNVLDQQFNLTKRKQLFEDINDVNAFDLIYFDCFGYRVQPDSWSTTMFRKMFNALKPKGVLVTYAARGVVKRSMIEVGFTVEKLEGPPGKREMFRATKK